MPSSSQRGRAPRARARSARSLRRRHGLTLIEAVVALVMLGLAGVAALEGAAQATRAERAGQAHLMAVSLADARLAALAASPTDSLRRRDPSQHGTIETARGPYHWRTTVQPAARNINLIEAAVRMEWDGGTYHLATMLYRPDVIARRSGGQGLDVRGGMR